MFKIVMIGAGGGAGAVLRYLVSGWGQRLAGGVFPAGTLTVNVVGCLLIGFLAAAFAGPHLIRDEVRLALMVGLLGGFTTFSSFGYETLALVNDGQWRYALLNVALNNGLGLLAAWAGYRFGEQWMGA